MALLKDREKSELNEVRNEKSVGRNSISWLWESHEAWFGYAVAGHEWNDEKSIW